MQLISRLAHAVAIIRVHHEDDSLSVLEVVPPERADLILAANCSYAPPTCDESWITRVDGWMGVGLLDAHQDINMARAHFDTLGNMCSCFLSLYERDSPSQHVRVMFL